jgi:hypothetical protein
MGPGYRRCLIWGTHFLKPGECPDPDDTQPGELVIEREFYNKTDDQACGVLYKLAGGKDFLLTKYASVQCWCVDAKPPIKTAGADDAGAHETDAPEGTLVETLYSPECESPHEAADPCIPSATDDACTACGKASCCDAITACPNSGACHGCLIPCVANGGEPNACADQCGHDQYVDGLLLCARDACAAPCGWAPPPAPLGEIRFGPRDVPPGAHP